MKNQHLSLTEPSLISKFWFKRREAAIKYDYEIKQDISNPHSKGTPACNSLHHVTTTLQQNDNDLQTTEDNKKLVIRNLHLESKKVKTGEKIERGQKIAISGNTGEDSDGYHLHIDVNDAETYDGKKFSRSNTIDPRYFWPRIFNGLTLVPHEYVGSNLKPDYDNPEWYFEDTLVEYVGEDTCLNWLSDQPEEEKHLVTQTGF